jgi:hypothetical protein
MESIRHFAAGRGVADTDLHGAAEVVQNPLAEGGRKLLNLRHPFRDVSGGPKRKDY